LTQPEDRCAKHFLDCRDARHQRLGDFGTFVHRRQRARVSSPLSLSALMSSFWQKAGAELIYDVDRPNGSIRRL
jgi:hypothetical protein